MKNLRLLEANIESQLTSIIRNREVTPYFQPIVDFASAKIFGYEALIRGPEDSYFNLPFNLFHVANLYSQVQELELLCLEVSCEAFLKFDTAAKLFVNISPLTLTYSGAEKTTVEVMLDQFKLDPQQVVIELSEKYPVDNYDVIHTAVKFYRSLGFQIAIDDLGSGYSGLRVWSEIRPEYVKIDKHFIKDLDNDSVKREFVRSINEVSDRLNCNVIAEGIESESELKALRTIGVSHGQGYLLGKPLKQLSNVVAHLVTQYSKFRVRKYGFTDTIADLVEYRDALHPSVTLNEVADMFCLNKTISSLPVVENSRVKGIVVRETILEMCLTRFGRELNSNKKISECMDKFPITVEQSSLLQYVSKLLVGEEEMGMNVDFIITNNGYYVGVGRTKRLLEKLTDQRISDDKYSNPLTMLPGNVPIYEWIDDLLQSKSDFYVAYFDLNYFKPYNDKYGYGRGDELIKWLAELISVNSSEKYDRVGHIGGDDFIVIFQSQDWYAKCESILSDFEQNISCFYSPEDFDSGCINYLDRTHAQKLSPLLTLAIGVVCPNYEECQSYHDVAQLALEAKYEAKTAGGNTLFVSRRCSPTSHAYMSQGQA